MTTLDQPATTPKRERHFIFSPPDCRWRVLLNSRAGPVSSSAAFSSCACLSPHSATERGAIAPPGEMDIRPPHAYKCDMKKHMDEQLPSTRTPATAIGAGAIGAQAIGAQAIKVQGIGGLAIGALAVGAVALGTLALGRLIIGRMAIRHTRLGVVEIDELRVGRLHVRELVADDRR
jgi:hypothetical protein